MSDDVICALDSIVNYTNFQGYSTLTRHIMTLFMTISCAIDELDIHQITLKVRHARDVD